MELEAFARPLWGLAPLAAGGGAFEGWELIRLGLLSGTDPAHPEFWGRTGARDQRTVEMGAIAAALLLAPHEVWNPLPAEARTRLAEWLDQADRHEAPRNNWEFFPVLVDLGLRRVGVRGDAPGSVQDRLERIARWYLGDGWYEDGEGGACDWYAAWAFHTYGLLYASSGLGDPARAAQFRERACDFAQQLVRWFAAGGAALPFGRSLSYRFAQAAFWGALALADVEALPWGQLKGLYLRSLRHWASRPVWDRDGVLSVGYDYANPRVAERYIAVASPYWAFKAFLSLAVPADHPFWTEAEEELPRPTGPVVQIHPGLALSCDADQVLAVSGRQRAPRHVADGVAKYSRFAYSSLFGPCLEVDAGKAGVVSDSTLVLVDGGGERRVRDDASDFETHGPLLATTWRPWPDVEVRTVLWGSAPWHVRVHAIRSGRQVLAEESGFGLGYEDEADLDIETRSGGVLVRSPLGCSGLLDPAGSRSGEARKTAPNASLTSPHAAVSVLSTTLRPGAHQLTTFVFAAAPSGAQAWEAPPAIPDGALRLAVESASRRPFRLMARRRGR